METLMLGGIGGRRRRGRQRMRWLDGITDLMDVSLSTELQNRRIFAMYIADKELRPKEVMNFHKLMRKI